MTVDVAAGGVGVEAGLVDELFSLPGVNAGDVDRHVGAYAEALDAIGEGPKLTAESMETSGGRVIACACYGWFRMNRRSLKASSALKSPTPIGLAGAGGGTLLALLANSLPSANIYKPWLVLLAPSLSISLATFVGWAKWYLTSKVSSRELAQLVQQSRETLSIALSNPETSLEYKAEMRKALERLEKLLVQSELRRIHAIGFILTS